MTDPLRVLSLGAGVQSSAVLLMSAAGEIPKLDAAVFADTGWEPPAVYAHLADVLMPRAEAADIPIYVVRRYTDGRTVRSRPWEMPVFVRRPDGRSSMLNRQCTQRFKIQPVRRQIRALLAERGEQPRAGSVEQWFGISWDESQRMRDSEVAYITHRYPLVDARLTRADCHGWLSRHGIDAPRSACIGCPFHTTAEWLTIQRDPELWADAVAVDTALRSERTRDGAPRDFETAGYLHASCQPLTDVTFEHSNQLGLFGDDCGGHCGV